MSKPRSWCELVGLFILLPVVAGIVQIQPVRLLLLLGATLYAVWAMRYESRVRWSISPRELWGILLRFLLAAGALTALVAWLDPGWWFRLPRTRPGLWLVIMLLYPLLSALPQEYLFRRFFFVRYRSILPTGVAILLNILLFGGLHLLYHNPYAVILATVGGILFTLNWRRTESLGAVTLEHSLCGMWLFTVGWGHYFYR